MSGCASHCTSQYQAHGISGSNFLGKGSHDGAMTGNSAWLGTQDGQRGKPADALRKRMGGPPELGITSNPWG